MSTNTFDLELIGAAVLAVAVGAVVLLLWALGYHAAQRARGLRSERAAGPVDAPEVPAVGAGPVWDSEDDATTWVGSGVTPRHRRGSAPGGR